MRQTSGIIINNEFFINSSNVSKILKRNTEEPEETHAIDIYMVGDTTPQTINFESESDCDVIFEKIIMEMYGLNYAHVTY